MQKCISIVLPVLLILVLASCAKGEKDENNTTVAPQTTKAAVTVAAEDNDSTIIDLTGLNNNMVYSELYNMVVEPEKFEGKIVKMRGTYAVYSGGGNNYYVCEVKDATACCTQGLEFVLDDGDYPEYDENNPMQIELVGIFATYTEDEQTYVHLEDASITPIQ